MPCFYEVGLIEPETLLERLPEELPSLVLRRLQLGIALARGSDTWLLDEPGCGIEAGSRLAWLELVRTASRERGASVLAVSRSARGLSHVADRVEWLHEGTLVEIEGEGSGFGEAEDATACCWAEALATLAIPENDGLGIKGNPG